MRGGVLIIYKIFIMKFSLPLAIFLLLSSSHYAGAREQLASVADGLDRPGCYRAEARFEVLLPNAEEPVGYTVNLECIGAQSDTLSPVSYYITWQGDTATLGRNSDGFSAYYDGNYYRYNAGKLQENHAADNTAPFAPGGVCARGVHRTDRFASLLPCFLGEKLRTMQADSTYTINIMAKGDNTVVKGAQNMNGYTVNEFEYIFDGNMMPLKWELVSNPGEMAEQTVTVTYAMQKPMCDSISEQGLIARHPEEFEKYRRDSFSLTSLKGQPMPSVSAATTAGGRFNYNRGEEMGQPCVMAVLRGDVAGNDEVVEALRAASESLPFATRLIFAFTDTDPDDINELTGPARPGETILRNARGVVRDFGVVDFPALLFIDAGGTVADIHVGRNNNLKNIVINMLTSIK